MTELNMIGEEPAPVTTVKGPSQLEGSLTVEVMKFYAHRATSTKKKVDEFGAEVSLRQDRMRHLNDLIAEINNLTDDKHCLDISKHPQLQEKLLVAKELGVKLKDKQLKFSSVERDRLLENLHLAADNWDKENKKQTQQMDIHIRELDRIMMFLKDTQKSEDRAKRSSLSSIKGG